MIRSVQKLKTKWELQEERNFELQQYNGDHKQLWCKETRSLLAEIHPNGVLTIYKGLKWDGCSYKYRVNILGKEFIIGAWDGFEDENGVQQLYEPSLVHDVLIRFYRGYKGHNFYTLKDIDVMFYNMMKERGVPFWQYTLYFGVVRCYSAWKDLTGQAKLEKNV